MHQARHLLRILSLHQLMLLLSLRHLLRTLSLLLLLLLSLR